MDPIIGQIKLGKINLDFGKSDLFPIRKCNLRRASFTFNAACLLAGAYLGQ